MKRFTATSVCRNADTLLWANPTELPFDGWHIHEWCVDTFPQQAWNAAVTVTFADGSRAVWTGSGNSHAPRLISSLLYYPADNAVEMTFAVKTAQGTAILSVPLRSVIGEGRSEHRRSDGIPYTLIYSPDNEFIVPAATAKPKVHQGKILSTHVGRPFEPISLENVSSTEIKAVTAATATTSAWDFARNRFYVFAPDGSFLAVTNGHGAISAVQRMDSRGVERTDAVAQGNNETGVIVLTAQREIVRVTGSKVKNTGLCAEDDAEFLTVDGSDIWVVSPTDEIKVFPADNQRGCYLRDDIEPEAVYSAGDDFLIVTAGGELLSGAKRHRGNLNAEWKYRVRVADCVKPPVRGAMQEKTVVTAVTLPVIENVREAEITLTTDCGSADSVLKRPLARATVRGCWKSPLTFPLRAAHRQWLELDLKAFISL